MPTLPSLASQTSPIASWSTTPKASGAMPRISVHEAASGIGSISSPKPGNASRPSHSSVHRRGRRLADAQRPHGALPQLVGADALRALEVGHRVQAPLDGGAGGAVVAEPGVRAVHVGVGRFAEAYVERPAPARRRSSTRSWRRARPRPAVTCPGRAGTARPLRRATPGRGLVERRRFVVVVVVVGVLVVGLFELGARSRPARRRRPRWRRPRAS